MGWLVEMLDICLWVRPALSPGSGSHSAHGATHSGEIKLNRFGHRFGHKLVFPFRWELSSKMKLGHETATKYALSNTPTWVLGPIRGEDDQTSKLPNELPRSQASFGE